VLPVHTLNGQALEWLYKDDDDILRGPFSLFDMRFWFNAGHFYDGLQVRHIAAASFVDIIRCKEITVVLPMPVVVSQMAGPQQGLEDQEQQQQQDQNGGGLYDAYFGEGDLLGNDDDLFDGAYILEPDFWFAQMQYSQRVFECGLHTLNHLCLHSNTLQSSNANRLLKYSLVYKEMWVRELSCVDSTGKDEKDREMCREICEELKLNLRLHILNWPEDTSGTDEDCFTSDDAPNAECISAAVADMYENAVISTTGMTAQQFAMLAEMFGYTCNCLPLDDKTVDNLVPKQTSFAIWAALYMYSCGNAMSEHSATFHICGVVDIFNS
jgi:hypothetical protein